jgi:hypothetical protein
MIVHCRLQVPNSLYEYDPDDDNCHAPSSPSMAMMVVPLPRYISSTMAPFQDIGNYILASSSSVSNMGPNTRDSVMANEDTTSTEPHLYHHYRNSQRVIPPEHFQALVYFPNLNGNDPSNDNHPMMIRDDSDLYPTLAYYTSEGTVPPSLSHHVQSQQHPPSVEVSNTNHSSNDTVSKDVNAMDTDDDDDDDGILLVSVTKAIFGTALGALRWGLTGGGGGGDHHHPKQHDPALSSPKRHESLTPPRKNHHPIDGTSRTQDNVEIQTPITLHMSTAFHDIPRTITYCTIDPDGRLAATADTLGRILLIDVTTKQIIRMWKGFRDATCYWIQQPVDHSYNHPDQNENISHNQSQPKIQLYLVIHSRQRRIVEVWPVRYGNRIFSKSVGRDAKIIPVLIGSVHGTERFQLAQCYIAPSTIPGSNGNQLEMIQVHSKNASLTHSTEADDHSMVINSPVRQQKKTSTTASKKLSSTTTSRHGTLPLKQLQQLLSATPQIQCTVDDVRNALYDISSLLDLITAIDLLATSPGLEEKLNVVGASFHQEVLQYCRDVLRTIVPPSDGQRQNDSSIQKNPHVRWLSQKIIYHEQVRRRFAFFP